MKAKIRYTGTEFKIYSLDQEGTEGDEVWTFVGNAAKPATKSYAKGFAQLLVYIANRGLGGLSKKNRDCWDEDGYWFCELKKMPWRISYFESGRKVLLVTVFRKKGRKAKKEYRRAIRLNETFKANPWWEG
jgi:hypothetical protein